MGGDRSTEGTESEVGSKKKERRNTNNTNPIEATSQSLLASFLHRSRELNLGIAIDEANQLNNTVYLIINTVGPTIT